MHEPTESERMVRHVLLAEKDLTTIESQYGRQSALYKRALRIFAYAWMSLYREQKKGSAGHGFSAS